MMERRHAGRRSVDSGIVIRTPEGGVAHGTIQNIALWGALIELPESFRVHTIRPHLPLILMNQTNGTNHVYRINARVTRRSERLLALSFEAMTPGALRALIDWLLSDDGHVRARPVSWQLWTGKP